MAVQYYVNLFNDGISRYVLKDIESLCNFLHLRAKGELMILDQPGIKIVYDIRSGQVQIDGVNNPRGVKNFFNEKAFRFYIKPVADAICIYSKFHLLNQINRLEAQQYPGIEILQKIIKKNAINSEKITLANVNAAIAELSRFLNEYSKKHTHQHPVYQCLLIIMRSNNIKCCSQVELIFEELKKTTQEQIAKVSSKRHRGH